MPETSEVPFLDDEGGVDGSVDHRGRLARRSSSGGWRSAAFIIVVQVAERFALFGMSANLITYLAGPLGQSTAAAAESVNVWSGTATLFPVVGAIVADSFLGRYTAIVATSLIYILGLGLLSLSAALTSETINNCLTSSSSSCSATEFQKLLFFISLYMVAIGQGQNPCVQAFGADQFDERHPKESEERSLFFNWAYCSAAIGINVELLVVVYVQDNFSWAVGFAIPCFAMIASLVAFLLGRNTYRFAVERKGDDVNPFLRIGRGLVRTVRNGGGGGGCSITISEQGEANSHQFNSTGSDVEETKQMLRLVPIWLSSLGFGVVFAQMTTFFTKQGSTLDRRIFSSGFQIPPASLQFFIGAAIVVFIPVYDRLFVPFMASVTGKPRGITMLQRIGTGMFLLALSVAIAAAVETKRLKSKQDEQPTMKIWWLVPQYVVGGVANVFAVVGLQEFFYEEVPKELKSLGVSFYLGVLGVGSFLSSFIVSLVDQLTGWLDDDLNKAHLDYFYWLLALLSSLWLAAFLFSARGYVYRPK